MMEIDWDKAPEGTTHAFAPDFWRKVTKDAVYSWSRTGGGGFGTNGLNNPTTGWRSR